MPKKFQAIKIHEEGRLEVLTWDEGPLDLDALRRHIGCEWVDAVHPHPASMAGESEWGDFVFWLDDEGMFNAGINMGSLALSNICDFAQPLFGNLIITGNEDKEGAITSLTDSQVKWIEEAYMAHMPKGWSNDAVV